MDHSLRNLAHEPTGITNLMNMLFRKSTADTPPGVANRALFVFELVEQILLSLPISQLFTIKRVCKAWDDLLAKSIPLRCKMFTLASQMGPIGPRDSVPFELVEYNPIFAFEPPARELEQKHPLPTVAQGVKLHFRRGDRNDALEWPIDRLIFPRWKVVIEPFPEATWRHMLVTQPPVSEMKIWTWGPKWLDRTSTWHRMVHVKNSKGVTMGDILEKATELLETSWADSKKRQEFWDRSIKHTPKLADWIKLKLLGPTELLRLDNYRWSLTSQFEED
jgi:hypothetical protein